MNSAEVQIVLSTYNGERFVASQIDSILNQTVHNWQLLINDDGSTDGTKQILEDYIERYPEKIKWVQAATGGSAAASFIGMLPFTNAPYVMFCDQDDVWKPTKIEVSMKVMKQVEKTAEIALVYSDMEVVDEALSVLHPSFLNQQKLSVSWSNRPKSVIVQSMAAGCTMLMNRALIDVLRPIVSELFLHDHWVMIHASLLGKIGYVNEATVLYRQHSNNTIGSHKVGVQYFYQKQQQWNNIFKRWRIVKEIFSVQYSMLSLFCEKMKLNVIRMFFLQSKQTEGV